jgi:hypothetical protein
MTSISKTSLVNGALIEIGVATIVSLTEDSEAARTANAIFDDLLDQELQEHNWTFARARAQLAAESSAPAFGYTYSHVLPSNPYCLHVLEEINDYEFMVEGRRILSDATPLQIRYIYRISDYNQLSAAFRKAFIFKLAAAFSIPLKGSAELKTAMEAAYTTWIGRAKSRDSQQDSPKDAFNDDHMDWAMARYTGGPE